MADDQDRVHRKGGDKPIGTVDPDILTEDEIAAERMGDNQLQAKDQSQQHNERKAQADVKHEADENTLDAFRKLDEKE